MNKSYDDSELYRATCAAGGH